MAISAQRQKHIEAWQASGLSQVETFAKHAR